MKKTKTLETWKPNGQRRVQGDGKTSSPEIQGQESHLCARAKHHISHKICRYGICPKSAVCIEIREPHGGWPTAQDASCLEIDRDPGHGPDPIGTTYLLPFVPQATRGRVPCLGCPSSSLWLLSCRARFYKHLPFVILRHVVSGIRARDEHGESSHRSTTTLCGVFSLPVQLDV